MTGPSIRSFEKFNYTLRPSKQVERKLLMQWLNAMAAQGLALRDYVYLGFGSPFYADFAMFHRNFGLDRMICVEQQKIKRRMMFNKPFGFVKLCMGSLDQVLPDLPRKAKYLVWLDYDYVLDRSILEDLMGLLQVVGAGSIVLVTVEAEPRLPDREQNKSLSRDDRESKALELFDADLARYLGRSFVRKDLVHSRLPRTFSDVLRNFFDDQLNDESGMRFMQLFNSYYADGAQMLTFGGIVTTGDEVKRLQKSTLMECKAVNGGVNPKWIGVPPLTIREKLWLDQRISGGRPVSGRQLDLPKAFVQNYCNYYKEYPIYSEVWL